MWKCAVCDAERQWGSISLSLARQEARLHDPIERLADRPILTCEGTCKDKNGSPQPTAHFYSRDVVVGMEAA